MNKLFCFPSVDFPDSPLGHSDAAISLMFLYTTDYHPTHGWQLYHPMLSRQTDNNIISKSEISTN